MTDARYAEVKKLLEQERDTVQHQLAEHGVPLEGDGVEVSVDEGFADSAQATTERSELLALVEQLRTHHEDVVAALGRLEDGTYGKCENCGQEIPVERLEVLPAARLCMACKQQG